MNVELIKTMTKVQCYVHGLRLAALEVNKLQPSEYDEKGQRDWFWEQKRKVWLECREAIIALIPDDPKERGE